MQDQEIQEKNFGMLCELIRKAHKTNPIQSQINTQGKKCQSILKALKKKIIYIYQKNKAK